MNSEKRTLAALANRGSSRGPVSLEGKRCPSMKAITHRSLSQHIVIGKDAPEAFEEMINLHLDRFEPCGEVEQTPAE